MADRTTSVGDLVAHLRATSAGAEAPPGAGPLVTSVTHDSRRVLPGALFCCVVGAHHDGHDHAADAVAAGAVALLCSRPLPDLDVPQVLVEDVRAALGPAAALVLGDPSRRVSVVGVTGTNGKTTVVTLVADLLGRAGRRAATIGTLTGARTTPEAPDLQAQLAAFADDGVTHVAMEVSSHALALGRVDAVEFAVGVFTNLGTDHLDFHGNREQYFAAKARLFEPGRCRHGVVNRDDVHGRLLLDAGTDELVGVSVDDLDDLRVTSGGSEFRWRGQQVRLPLPGRHNVTNALLAAETCVLLGVPPTEVAAALGSAPTVPGRFERVDEGQPFLAAVDYAHTPDALAAVLGAAREMVAPGGRVVVVVGCGGDRDRGKRPQMGAVACELADLVVLTTDNPRSEDPAVIAAEVLAGCPADAVATGRLVDEPDRAAAVRRAVAAAGPGDVVVVAGKGHETEQVVGATSTPFDDRVVLAAALRDRPGSGAQDGGGA